MGWSKGKGLGANLDGQLDFIKVSHKGDQKGVGFKDRDDQWTTHESNFNSLLLSFKSTENSDEETQDCAVQGFRSDDKIPKKENVYEKEELFSGVSLEEQSKNSRARVHYKKFTRGKDLSRYSEKDLANIFGKKKLKCDAEAEGSIGESKEEENSEKSSENTPNFGITTIETGTTIADYFKNKMRNAVNGSKNSSDEQINNVESASGFIKKEKKGRKKSKATEIVSQDSETVDNNQVTNIEMTSHLEQQSSIIESMKRERDSDSTDESKSIKKKKKKNKSIEQIGQVVEAVDKESEIMNDKETLPTSKKTKKNKKPKDCAVDKSAEKPDATRRTKCEARIDDHCQIVNIEETQPSKKKSKKRTADCVEDSQSTSNNKCNDEAAAAENDNSTNGVDVEKHRPRKKSKKDPENKQTESCDDRPTIPPTDQQSANLFDYVADAGKQNAWEIITDNVYEIRRHRSELFRYVDLQAFPGSTLSDIPGYGYTNEITLKIVDKGDENRLINTFWNDALDKYANGKNANGKKKKKKFVEHIGDLKKKNIFKI